MINVKRLLFFTLIPSLALSFSPSNQEPNALSEIEHAYLLVKLLAHNKGIEPVTKNAYTICSVTIENDKTLAFTLRPTNEVSKSLSESEIINFAKSLQSDFVSNTRMSSGIRFYFKMIGKNDHCDWGEEYQGAISL